MIKVRILIYKLNTLNTLNRLKKVKKRVLNWNNFGEQIELIYQIEQTQKNWTNSKQRKKERIQTKGEFLSVQIFSYHLKSIIWHDFYELIFKKWTITFFHASHLEIVILLSLAILMNWPNGWIYWICLKIKWLHSFQMRF